jgi:Tol biopolymer transport system component
MPDNLREKLQSTLGDAYTLERELGGGGMSRVFVAEDNAFGRKIVVKMLPSETAASVSVERFKREIKVVARLQHPHIVPVLTAGQIDDLPFYTMPFVKGESLRARLERSGEMSVNEALHVLRDVAAALAYAHGEGIVHRDIKPDNVILSGGVAVVTDFGVAKAVDVAATGSEQPSGMTSLGVALGTPAYMSPEQASADPRVDHRADIYSFGCLAYELLAGSSPFAGRSPQQMLAAHVTETPEPLIKRRPQVPPALSALVMRCLEKRAGDRPQSADDLLASLDGITTTPSGGTSPTAERLRSVRRVAPLKWIGAVALLAIALIGAQWWKNFTAVPPLTVGATTPIAIGPELELAPAISPDGKLVAYAARTSAGSRIFVRQIDGSRANMISGELPGNHGLPKWSPDGSRVSFAFADAIYIVPATGGSPRRAIDDGDTHSWSRDGKGIVYSTADRRFIRLQSLDGGTPRTLVDAKGTWLHSPVISPDGRILLYNEGRIPEFYNVSGNRIWSVAVAGGPATLLSDTLNVNLSPVWMPDGRSVLFLSNMGGTRDVYQLPVTGDGRPRGEATRLTTGLSSYWISLSADGSRLAYDVVRNFSNVYVAPFRGGTVNLADARPITDENQHIEGFDLSHDGQWIAYDSDRGGNFDIYKQRVSGGEPIQLTTNPANEFAPSWSPDDTELAFHSTRNGTRDIYTISAEGTAERQVTSGPDQDFSPDWSPDGRRLVYNELERADSNDVFTTARDRAGKWSPPTPISNRAGKTLQAAKWSPDGNFISAAVDFALVLFSADGGSRRMVFDPQPLGGIVIGTAWGRNSATVFAVVSQIRATEGAPSLPAQQAIGTLAVYAIPVAGGPARLVVADKPGERFARWEIAVDDKRLFFTRAAWESNVWMMSLKR